MVPDSFYDLRIHERFAQLLLADSQSSPAQRAMAIARIKAMPYSEFLQTEYWQVVRNYVVYKAEWKCRHCHQSAAAEVHHKSYKHHGQEHLYLADLEALCRDCHEAKQAKFDNAPAPPEVAKGTLAQAVKDVAATLSRPRVSSVRAELWDEERRASEKFSLTVFGEKSYSKIQVSEDYAADVAEGRENRRAAEALEKRLLARLSAQPVAEPAPAPITQADIDAAIAANNRQRAAELAKDPRHEGLARLEAQ